MALTSGTAHATLRRRHVGLISIDMGNRRLRLLRSVHCARSWAALAAWIAVVVLVDVSSHQVGALVCLVAVAAVAIARTVSPKVGHTRRAPAASQGRRLVA